MDVDSFRKVPYWQLLFICKTLFPCEILLTKIVAYAVFSSGLVLAAFLYIVWLSEADQEDDAGGNSKEGADNSQDKEKRRIRSEKEDWHVVRGGLATWRGRQKENLSRV